MSSGLLGKIRSEFDFEAKVDDKVADFLKFLRKEMEENMLKKKAARSRHAIPRGKQTTPNIQDDRLVHESDQDMEDLDAEMAVCMAVAEILKHTFSDATGTIEAYYEVLEGDYLAEGSNLPRFRVGCDPEKLLQQPIPEESPELKPAISPQCQTERYMALNNYEKSLTEYIDDLVVKKRIFEEVNESRKKLEKIRAVHEISVTVGPSGRKETLIAERVDELELQVEQWGAVVSRLDEAMLRRDRARSAMRGIYGQAIGQVSAKLT